MVVNYIPGGRHQLKAFQNGHGGGACTIVHVFKRIGHPYHKQHPDYILFRTIITNIALHRQNGTCFEGIEKFMTETGESRGEAVGMLT